MLHHPPSSFIPGIESLVPAQYARYAPLIADGLRFFLTQLPAWRQAEIIAEQQLLPRDAAVAERLVRLMHACPTLHKLGQVLARHRDLDPDLRRRLHKLESLEPHTPVDTLAAHLDELRACHHDVWLSVAHTALAEGSVAVVVPFEWSEAHGDGGRGVLKVLRPGIEQRLAEDLAAWARTGPYLQERAARLGLGDPPIADTLERVQRLLLAEIDLAGEQAHLAEAARTVRHARVIIPRLLPFCTPRVTAMEYVPGAKVTDAVDAPAWRRRALAEAAVEALVAGPFLSAEPAALFHADPHGGNLLAAPDGRLAVLDWSLAGRLSKQEREHLAQAVLGGATLDAGRVARAVTALAAGGLDVREAGLHDAARSAVGELRRGALPGVSWLTGLLDAAAVGGVRFGDDLLLFRKTLLMIEGVVTDICPDVSVDAVLLRVALGAAWAEWPRRWLSPPWSREFATHVSLADLWSTLFRPAAFAPWLAAAPR